jgi:hypothetical protein
MSDTRVTLNPRLLDEIAANLMSGLDRFNEELVQRSKANLYPGHGLLTGRMQAALGRRGAVRNGLRIEADVGVYGVLYSLLVHLRYYQFVTDALEAMLPEAPRIIGGG